MIQLCPYCKKQWCKSTEHGIKEHITQKLKDPTVLMATVLSPMSAPFAALKPDSKYLFHCPNCGNEWGTNDEKDNQIKEYQLFKEQAQIALTSPTSDNPIENYKTMKCLINYKENGGVSQSATKLYKERLEELSYNYINKFLDIPERERRFLVVVDDMEYLPDSFVVLPINKIPRGILFPAEHPRSQELYVVHPYKPNEYIPYNIYLLSLFRDEIDEFSRIMECMGAKSISFHDERTKEKQLGEQSDKKTSGGVSYNDKFGANASYSRGETSTEYKKLANKLKKAQKCNLTPNIFPYIPHDTVWYQHRPEWHRICESRKSGRLSEISLELNTSEVSATSEQERMKIEADLKVLLFKANGSHEQEENVSLRSEESHKWTIDVEFYPLSAYNASDSNKVLPQNTQSATLTSEEEEYLTELKETLADGEVSPKERRLLEKIRIQYGISETRAAELENSLTALKLTEEEQEYLDEYKDVIADGEITEKARRLLDKIRKMKGISEERAREIETSVKR